MPRCQAALEAGLCPNSKFLDKGETLLTQSVKCGHGEIVELLLKHGANPDDRNKEMDTPLLIAAAKKNFEICKMLVANGASMAITSGNGVTPLMKAARDGDVGKTLKIVEFLIEKGCEINATDSNDQNVLHYAVPGSNKIVKFLLDKGAQVNVISKTGWTPLLKACSMLSCGNSLLLAQYGADFTIGKTSIWQVASDSVKQHLQMHGFNESNTLPTS